MRVAATITAVSLRKDFSLHSLPQSRDELQSLAAMIHQRVSSATAHESVSLPLTGVTALSHIGCPSKRNSTR